MKKIKNKYVRNIVMPEFEEIVCNYVDEGLLKERFGMKPVLYYNGPRISRLEFLPEFYAVYNRPSKKTSHQFEVHDKVKQDYFACMVYVNSDDLNKVLETIGYSTERARRLRNTDNIYNIFKLNYYGEQRNVDLVPFALVQKDTVLENVLETALDRISLENDMQVTCIPVIRETDEGKTTFLELNADISRLYHDFETINFEKIKRQLYLSTLLAFPTSAHIILLQADGTDLSKSRDFQRAIDSYLRKPFPSKYEKSMMSYANVEPTNNGTSPKSKAFQKALANAYDYPTAVSKVTIDDREYRTMLYYMDKRRSKAGVSIESNIQKKFNTKVTRAPVCETGQVYQEVGIAVKYQDSIEFANKLPWMHLFWRNLGLDKNADYLYYRNYYNELCDPKQTPFMLVRKDYDSVEMAQLLQSLKQKYNFNYKVHRVDRVVKGDLGKFTEISLRWFADDTNARSYFASFENSLPILKNIEEATKEKCEQNGVEYYPIYANGQLK